MESETSNEIEINPNLDGQNKHGEFAADSVDDEKTEKCAIDKNNSRQEESPQQSRQSSENSIEKDTQLDHNHLNSSTSDIKENICCKSNKQPPDPTLYSAALEKVSKTDHNDTDNIEKACLEAIQICKADSILQNIVTEDLSSIKDQNNLKYIFYNYLSALPCKVVSELLSVLIAILKKSVFQQEMSRDLIKPCINYLTGSILRKTDDKSNKDEDKNTDPCESLTKHFLKEWINLVITHSCDVHELESLLEYAKFDASIVQALRSTYIRQQNIPHSFFGFPGTKGSMIGLPPIQKWPIQNGWSFSTWFSLEPKSYAQPYLFNFKTGKSGLGYSAHFTGNCLVLTSIRVKGKGLQHCVSYEFPSLKWIHCAITYHSKWRAPEIKVYVNGQLSANIGMQWQVQTSEIFDKCFIGGSGTLSYHDRSDELNCFRGQMAAINIFDKGLTASQICAIHRLGPSYMGQYKMIDESILNLPTHISKVFNEEKLYPSLFCLYNPSAVDEGALSLQLAPVKTGCSDSAINYFISSPHAALLGNTKAIITSPIYNSLQSVSMSQTLLPLFTWYAREKNVSACMSLMSFICDLLESPFSWFGQEMVQQNGFVIISKALEQNSRVLLNSEMLDIFINFSRSLLTLSNNTIDVSLFKHFMDNILFKPSLWIYADSRVQIKLFTYFASSFLNSTEHNSDKSFFDNTTINNHPYVGYNPTTNAANLIHQSTSDDIILKQSANNDNQSTTDSLFGEVRRVSTILQLIHSLKYYYWLAEEESIDQKCKDTSLRPSKEDLVEIRSLLLQFILELILKSNTIPYDELQGILNYIACCKCQENIVDVLDLIENILSSHPELSVPAIDGEGGIKVFFNLVGFDCEIVRVQALRLIALFLSQCSISRKQDIMTPHNLYMLLYRKLKKYKPLTREIYDALVDIMLETDYSSKQEDKLKTRNQRDLSKNRIENSMIVKVIANLLSEDQNDACMNNQENIKNLFINDLFSLIANNRENRRSILQMSVWQHWLIHLIDSNDNGSQLVFDQVIFLFRILLYHATRYEFGGWRVWIDTLAIIHTKFSYDEYCKQSTKEALKKLASLNLENESFESHSKTKVEIDETQSTSPSSSMQKAEEDSPNEIPVSSISERIKGENTGIHLHDYDDAVDHNKEEQQEKTLPDESIQLQNGIDEKTKISREDLTSSKSAESFDSVDLAPSREYRRQSLNPTDGQEEQTDQGEEIATEHAIVNNNESVDIEQQASISPTCLENRASNSQESNIDCDDNQCPSEDCFEDISPSSARKRVNFSPSLPSVSDEKYKIPEFKWCNPLIKLLNDLMFSIECDLYSWRCPSSIQNVDSQPFVPNTAESASASNSNPSKSMHSNRNAASKPIELALQRPENQIYIVNIIHFVSQLADNIIIASGGLLPLLAEATGGNKANTSGFNSKAISEGLSPSQADSILYRLVNIIDMVIFATSRINLNELEAEKNTTAGGILRQCFRLVLQTTVKNCLVINYLKSKHANQDDLASLEFPKEIFNSYQGCSILSASGLFTNSTVNIEKSDLVANIEYSPHQTPNPSFTPSILPFQPAPIKDFTKLLQAHDIARIQACIYYSFNNQSRQSQFLALTSLYFISVLMVSKYRDIIEPKSPEKKKKIDTFDETKSSQEVGQDSLLTSSTQSTEVESKISNSNDETSTHSITTVEENMMKFGNIRPVNDDSISIASSNVSKNKISDSLTGKLEQTLDSICPLLKSIMCDFNVFLSKTLLGSKGQDLVSRETIRTFKRPNASPVELVMLLCSQEWQNTLQKNAGLAFIELINEGRVLSLNMKEHIVRVAMEAEFILNGLRADDIVKHEIFNLNCANDLNSREHEEAMVDSLINSERKNNDSIYQKFIDSQN